MSSLFGSDSSESAQPESSADESIVNCNVLQPETRKQKLADLGYYEPGLRDPQDQQSRTMEILLSGDEDQVKSEYSSRQLILLSTKPNGTNHYDDTTVHLMAQVLHSHERLAEARRQIDFLEDFIMNGDSKTAYRLRTSAGEIIKDSEEMLTKAKKWKIQGNYKARFEVLTEHIEKSTKNVQSLLGDLTGSKKRSLQESQDTEMSDAAQQVPLKRPKRVVEL